MSNKTMEPAQQLAQDILKLSFNLLRVRLRFLDLALSGLRPHQAPGASLLTDGSRLYYGAAHVLRRYKAGQEQVGLFPCVSLWEQMDGMDAAVLGDGTYTLDQDDKRAEP